jgi:hypothetical protein
MNNYITDETCTFKYISSPKCTHHTGWYGYIKTFWSKVFGTSGIKFYCCSLCGDVLQGKELENFKNRKRN